MIRWFPRSLAGGCLVVCVGGCFVIGGGDVARHDAALAEVVVLDEVAPDPDPTTTPELPPEPSAVAGTWRGSCAILVDDPYAIASYDVEVVLDEGDGFVGGDGALVAEFDVGGGGTGDTAGQQTLVYGISLAGTWDGVDLALAVARVGQPDDLGGSVLGPVVGEEWTATLVDLDDEVDRIYACSLVRWPE